MKTCSKCGISKPLQDFAKDGNRQNGVKGYCKQCAAKRQRRYRDANRDLVLGIQRKWYSNNKETVSRRNKEWAKLNRGYLMVRGAKTRAKQAKLPFDLDSHIQDIQRRVDAGFCELTGLPFTLNGDRAWDSPSLDRIDPKKGYVYSNVRVVCRAINCMLGHWGPDIMKTVYLAYSRRLRK